MVYYYEGRCPRSGEWLRLPRSPASEDCARALMQELAQAAPIEGKMYGVLLATTADGQLQVFKAFSGLWRGQREVAGWVPPIPGRQLVAEAEIRTLDRLTAIQQDLQRLKELPERSQYINLQTEYEQSRAALLMDLKAHQQARQQRRQELAQRLTGEELQLAHDQLATASQQDGLRKRRWKKQWDEMLQPIRAAIGQADRQIQELQSQRKVLSQQLQTQMHQAAELTNFAGESRSLQQLRPKGLPTGSGECCAPKLLHHAATHGLRLIAMAEFWWGPAVGDKQPGEFYGACVDRCQPLLGFMLSGLSAQVRATSHRLPLEIIYSDEHLLVVNKPSGLLSVPGRYGQENVLEILQGQDSLPLWAVHRLDRDTSGVLLLARDLATYRSLSQQFANRQVRKIYEALLAGVVQSNQGTIDLPLAADYDRRPQQKVDWQRGKPSVTHYRVLAIQENQTRIEFQPVTGRTHQLRLHAVAGLGMPIVGDRLYGSEPSERLCLHAREISCIHPHTGQELHWQVPATF